MAMIRHCRVTDIEALHAISLATGHLGSDAARLHDDPRLLGHIYAAPYATLAPGLALVVEDAAGVAGFAVGAVDTPAWEALLESAWWPDLRRRYADPDATSSEAWTADQRRAFMIHHPRPTPAEVTRQYPAHLHMNLLPRQQRRGVGPALLRAWLAAAAGHGARCVHVGVNRANAGALRFWERHGFRPVEAALGRTQYLGRAVEPEE